MKKRALLIPLLLFIGLSATGCQTLLDTVSRIRTERSSQVEVKNLSLTVADPASERAGSVVALIAKDAAGSLLPVLCGGYTAARCGDLEPGAAIWVNEGLMVGCSITFDEVTYTRCVEPAPGDLRRRGM